MTGKILYVSQPAYLSLRYNQIIAKDAAVEKSDADKELKKESQMSYPVDDVGTLILDHKQITITSSLMNALAEKNCAVVVCNGQHMPSGLFLPLSGGNSLQSKVQQWQYACSEPLRKNLWAQTVKMKINNQKALLDLKIKCETGNMRAWAEEVRTGDATNREATAAVYYWSHLFPGVKGFTRGRDGVPPNNLLNYGYAILRATVARSLVAHGLNPTIGIFHSNQYNAYCLADDVMEPYRPFVDQMVTEIMHLAPPTGEMVWEQKSRLLGLPRADVTVEGVKHTLAAAIDITVASFVKCLQGERRKIAYPSLKTD